MKQVITLLLMAVLIYSAFVFVKTPHKSEEFLRYIQEKTVQLTETPRERIKDFFEEKKEVVEEEIEKEKQQIIEDARETGRSVWQKIGDFIFRRESEE